MEACAFVAEGVELAATRWPGPPGTRGSPVLLVHGLGGCTIEWDAVGGPLAEALGSDVVAVDLPGFGRSRLPRGRAIIPTHVRVVSSLLDELGPALLVGNSMGGLISLAVAARRPEVVTRLVLVGPALLTAGGRPGNLATAARYTVALTPMVGPAMIAARRRRTTAEAYVDDRLKAIVRDPARIGQGVKTRLVAQAGERASFAEASRCYSDAARSIFTGLRSAWRAVRDVTVPALVIHGDHDALVPVALVERLRRARPDWSYTIFDDAGHLPHLEMPERFVEVVAAWMSDQSS